MDLRKVLKCILVYSVCMIILKTVPVQEIDCDDTIYMGLALTTAYLIIDMYLPTYQVKVSDDKVVSVNEKVY